MKIVYLGEEKPIFKIISHQNVFDSYKVFNKSEQKFPFQGICSNLNASKFNSKELNESLKKFSDQIGKVKDECF